MASHPNTTSTPNHRTCLHCSQGCFSCGVRHGLASVKPCLNLQRLNVLHPDWRIWRVLGGDVKDIVPFVPIAQVSMLNSRHKKTLVPQPVVAFLSSTCLSFKVGLRLSKTGEVCWYKVINYINIHLLRSMSQHVWLDQTVSCSLFLPSGKPLGLSTLTSQVLWIWLAFLGQLGRPTFAPLKHASFS